MKKQNCIFFLLVFFLSCKKEKQYTASVKYTTVSGYVYNPISEQPMANVGIAIVRCLEVSWDWAGLNEDKVIDSAYTNDSGYFQMSFADTIPADSFVITYCNPHLYITNPVTLLIALDQKNIFTLYIDTIPLLYLHLHIINNHDSVDVLPDDRWWIGNFYIYPVTFDTTIILPVLPNTTYQMLYRYDEQRDTMYTQVQNINIGNYQDTFQRTLTVDPSTFLPDY